MAAPVAKADNLTVEQAREAAAHYLQHTTNLTRLTADQLTLVHQQDNAELGVPSMYWFNAPEDGWIIMAGTTVVNPVVGYSGEGLLNMNNLPPQMVDWVGAYNEIICAVQRADAEKDYPDCSEWKLLASKGMEGNTKDGDVIILGDIRWNQGTTAGYWANYSTFIHYGTTGDTYDMLTPVASTVNGVSYRSPVGCVATALAMICMYYQYPTNQASGFAYTSWPRMGSQSFHSGSGSASVKLDTIEPFDYEKMVNIIPFANAVPRAKRMEMSRLGYYIGLVVQMEYAADGSSSNMEKVVNNFPARFKYNTPTLVTREYAEQTFLNGIRNELYAWRPVYMSAANSYTEPGATHDAAGHAFVCDGYTDDVNMYHFNWGWNGEGNGFYNLVGNTTQNMFIEGQYLSYTLRQSVLTRLYPGENFGVEEVTNPVSLGTPYPNPASLSISLPYYSENAADLTIYNALGQQVESHRVQAGTGTLKVRVDNMPNGVYIYRLGDAYGKFIVK